MKTRKDNKLYWTLPLVLLAVRFIAALYRDRPKQHFMGCWSRCIAYEVLMRGIAYEMLVRCLAYEVLVRCLAYEVLVRCVAYEVLLAVSQGLFRLLASRHVGG